MSVGNPTPPARVRTLRALSVVLAFTAVVTLAFGTAGFTAISAERGVAVNVTDDDSAYLGYEPLAHEVDSGESTAVVEYRNRFGTDLDEFHVDVSTGGATVKSVNAPDELNAGSAETVDVTLSCSTERDIDLRFEARGSSSGVAVALNRTQEVTCVPPADQLEIVFVGMGNGKGNAEIRGPSRLFPLEVVVDTNQGTYNTTVGAPNEKIRSGGNVPGKIQTVRIPKYGIEESAPNASDH